MPADRLVAEVDALADRLARVPPEVMAPTKLMLNRAMDAAGFLAAVEAGLDLQSFVNMSETAREFDAIVRRDGLKAALAWRDERYDERLAGSATGAGWRRIDRGCRAAALGDVGSIARAVHVNPRNNGAHPHQPVTTLACRPADIPRISKHIGIDLVLSY